MHTLYVRAAALALAAGIFIGALVTTTTDPAPPSPSGPAVGPSHHAVDPPPSRPVRT